MIARPGKMLELDRFHIGVRVDRRALPECYVSRTYMADGICSSTAGMLPTRRLVPCPCMARWALRDRSGASSLQSCPGMPINDWSDAPKCIFRSKTRQTRS